MNPDEHDGGNPPAGNDGPPASQPAEGGSETSSEALSEVLSQVVPEAESQSEELTAEEELAQERAEARQAARTPETPRPPTLPPRWDQGLESLKAGPTAAETQRNRRSHVAPAMIPLDRVDEDDTFQVRPLGELSGLATDIARLGQLFPVDVRLRPPDRFQIISGFRRVAALRFLQRDRVLARLHTDLSDEDALHMALAAAIHAEPVTDEELTALRERLESEHRLSAATRDMIEKALAQGDELAPENVEEEVDADELADDVTLRLGEINQDLALLADVFSQLDDQRKEELLRQLGYSSELVAFLGGK